MTSLIVLVGGMVAYVTVGVVGVALCLRLVPPSWWPAEPFGRVFVRQTAGLLAVLWLPFAVAFVAAAPFVCLFRLIAGRDEPCP